MHPFFVCLNLKTKKNVTQANSQGMSVLLDVESIFFESVNGGLALKSDYQKEWENLISTTVNNYISKKLIIGFFMGDELTWNGLPYEQVLFFLCIFCFL